MFDSLLNRPISPEKILVVQDESGVTGMLLGVAQQLLGGVRPSVPQHVFAQLQQLGRNLVVQRQTSSIHNSYRKKVKNIYSVT